MSGDIPEPDGVKTDDRVMSALEAVDEHVQGLPEGSRTRPVGLAVLAAGLACTLLPGVCSRPVGGTVARLLDVSYETSEHTGGRLRILGVATIAAGAHLAYHGSVRPDGFDA